MFNPPHSKRFYKSTTDVPGPGVYQPKNDIANDGKYVLSKCVAAGHRKFLDGRRLSFTDLSARRSFSIFDFMQPLDLAVTEVLQNSDNMISRKT